MKKTKQFVLSALLLSGASLLMRTVAVAFNAFCAARVGAEGMGIFSLCMSIYTFSVTLATSGVSLAATRTVVHTLAFSDTAGARRAMKKCFLYAFSFSLFASCLLFAFSEFVALEWLRDIRTLPSLRALSISLVPIALSSVIGGYFSAVRRVFKSAAAQVFEQAVKILICSFLLMLLMPAGLEYACLALVLGGALAEFASFLFMFFEYLLDRRRHLKVKTPSCTNTKILPIALPVAFSSYARSGLVTLEHILIPRGLEKFYGKTHALEAYGILEGMSLPILLYPSAFVSAFAGLLIPEVAEFHAKGNSDGIRSVCERVTRLTLFFSIGVGGIMICFSHELCMCIYENIPAGKYLGALAPLIPVMYLDHACDAVLKGIDRQVYSMVVNIIDASASVVLVFFLVPKIGVFGYIATIYFTEILNSALSLYKLLEVTGFRVRIFAWLIKPTAAVIFACALARQLVNMAGGLFGGGLVLTAEIAVCFGFYVLFLFLLGGIRRADIRALIKIFEKSGAKAN